MVTNCQWIKEIPEIRIVVRFLFELGRTFLSISLKQSIIINY